MPDPLVLPPDEMGALAKAAEAAYGPGWRDKITILPPGRARSEAVLCDVIFIAEVRHLPDGTDETNDVRIRVTADHGRPVPASLEANLVSVVKSHLPAAADGWHAPARCADE